MTTTTLHGRVIFQESAFDTVAPHPPLCCAAGRPGYSSTSSNFSRQLIKHCSGHTTGASYHSLRAAEAACASSARCTGVYDSGCNNRGPFLMCATSSLSRSRHSCVYVQGGTPCGPVLAMQLQPIDIGRATLRSTPDSSSRDQNRILLQTNLVPPLPPSAAAVTLTADGRF